MKKLVLASAAAASLGFASFAVAGGSVEKANDGFYVGLGIGAAALDVPSDLFNDKVFKAAGVEQNLQNNWGFAARVEAGYLKAITSNILLGAELGFNYLPQSQYTYDSSSKDVDGNVTQEHGTIKYTDYNIDALLVAKYLLPSQFNVFAKGGFAYVHQKVKASDFTLALSSTDEVTFSGSDTNSRILPELAAGVGYSINANIDANLTYAHIFGDSVSDSGLNNVPSSNSVLVGIDYKFDL